jgi:hypothetical protein
MGEMPDYYPLVRAARYLHVAPWELTEQAVWWQDVANICETAEGEAQEERSKHPTY